MRTHYKYSGPRNNPCSFLGYTAKTRPNFGQIFSIIISKHAKKHHIEIIKINHLEKFLKLQKWLKIAVLLDLEGQIIIPFSNLLLITLKYAKKHHIKKSDEFIQYNLYYNSQCLFVCLFVSLSVCLSGRCNFCPGRFYLYTG